VAEMVKVRQVVTTVDAKAGTEMWTPDGPNVAGMVAGGYWQVVDRRPPVDAVPVSKRARKAPPEAEEGEPDGGEDSA